MISSDGVDAGS